MTKPSFNVVWAHINVFAGGWQVGNLIDGTKCSVLRCLTLRCDFQHVMLTLFENRVLRRIFGPKRDKVLENGENYTMRSLMICTPHSVFSG